MDTVAERIRALRLQLATEGLDAWIINGKDPHNSEYPPQHWQSRAWLSGFTGSAGTLVVTRDQAALWTDSRYWIQAARELQGSGIQLMEQGQAGVLEPGDWLAKGLVPESRLGLDGMTLSRAQFQKLEKSFRDRGHELVLGKDLLEDLWGDRPARPQNAVEDVQGLLAGESRQEKLGRLKTYMASQDVQAHWVSALDEIAWLLNLRGRDVAYNPVFLAHLMVLIPFGQDGGELHLFTDGSLPDSLARDLECFGWALEVHQYEAVQAYPDSGQGLPELSQYSPEPSPKPLLLADAQSLAEPLARSLETLVTVRYQPSVLALWKAVKCETELQALEDCHRQDALALVRTFAHWAALARDGSLTEAGAAAQAQEERRRLPGYREDSFPAIPGFGDHGAIVHYSVTPESDRTLVGPGLFLFDSGAHYNSGTTDVTRTLFWPGTQLKAEPDPLAIKDYTLVLRAHIHLASSRFPRGTRGYQLDALTRDLLWREGCQYGHGTGHGVGFCLNVHEGPVRLAPESGPVALEPGMVLSNEPGLYREGRWGIRLENLQVVVPGPTTEFGEFLQWEILTLLPFESRLVDLGSLDAAEKAWLHSYHQKVLQELLPGLQDARDQAARAWLNDSCAPFLE